MVVGGLRTMHEDEAVIREAWDRGDFDRAVEIVITRLGPQLLGYISAITREHGHDREIFSILAEDLWRGLPRFEWRSTVRAWAFKLARNARARFLIDHSRRARTEVLVGPAWLTALVQQTRSPTPPHLRTDVKDRFRDLRGRLDEEEQMLLMLRIDRKMSWSELAVALDEVRADESTTTASARLRQRFAVLKQKLRTFAEHEGLLSEHEH